MITAIVNIPNEIISVFQTGGIKELEFIDESRILLEMIQFNGRQVEITARDSRPYDCIAKLQGVLYSFKKEWLKDIIHHGELTATKNCETNKEDSHFIKDLKRLLNCHSKENGSDTPDFILARYLEKCLEAFDETVKSRESWYGREKKPVEVEPSK